MDAVLVDASAEMPRVLVHGDLHGHNQVWDPAQRALVAVVDFEESGVADVHFDFRYLPQNARSLEVLLAAIQTYQHLSGRSLSIERVMAWNVLTVLGDALWRSEARVALPGGGKPAGWVDDLSLRLDSLGMTQSGGPSHRAP